MAAEADGTNVDAAGGSVVHAWVAISVMVPGLLAYWEAGVARHWEAGLLAHRETALTPYA
ncbi:MAG: hypothetical protein ACRDSL_24575 [Pseudonocardiaceae bacterium]